MFCATAVSGASLSLADTLEDLSGDAVAPVVAVSQTPTPQRSNLIQSSPSALPVTPSIKLVIKTPLTSSLLASAVQYENAEGVPRDYEKAAALYCKAAKMGDADAQYALGWMYANGRGMPRNDAIAAQLFSLAADRGHLAAKAMRHLTASTSTAPLPGCLLPDPVGGRALTASALFKAGETGPAMSQSYFKGPIYTLVSKLAERQDIDPKLVMAVILVESGFNAKAVSPRNAQGLMQLIPETAQRFRVKNAFDPEENIKGGIAYLKWLLAYFKGDVALVAAAYNAGEGTVEKYRGVPPYPETQKYVQRIAQLYQKALHPYQQNLVKPSAVWIKNNM
jgi:soluble lytic murein transglycosylase-like protein